MNEMKKKLFIFFLCPLPGLCQIFAQNTIQDTLPDNHLLFILQIQYDKLEGASEYLEGFTISMDLPQNFSKTEITKNTLMTLVRNQEITGTLTYPNGKTSEIQYEVVRHRETEAIYMKTTLGYFLWESATIQDDKLFFVINWWYCPPACKADLEILKLTEQLLADSTNWHKNDDRKCENDIESKQWSLFCALKYASIEKMGEYNHHNTAMQTVRFVIDDIVPNHKFEHTLMDYNNALSTTHKDILKILSLAKENIEQQL
jgi:hypothetical protein